jgi:hypothetical protein
MVLEARRKSDRVHLPSVAERRGNVSLLLGGLLDTFYGTGGGCTVGERRTGWGG